MMGNNCEFCKCPIYKGEPYLISDKDVIDEIVNYAHLTCYLTNVSPRQWFHTIESRLYCEELLKIPEGGCLNAIQQKAILQLNPKVKQLVWEERKIWDYNDRLEYSYIAHTSIGTFSIHQSKYPDENGWCLFKNNDYVYIKTYQILHDAKLDCQKYFENIILAALEHDNEG